MAEEDDPEWLDALAGRSSQDEGASLRQALLSRSIDDAPPVAATDARREEDLVTRARFQGLQVDASALEGDPFKRRMSWGSALRASSRGWVAACIAVGVLVIGWQFRTPISQDVVRSAPGAVVRLLAPNPSALKQNIVDELRAEGVDAIGYERLGLSGVDAELPRPVTLAVQATLRKYRIPLPADGVVRVEIALEGR